MSNKDSKGILETLAPFLVLAIAIPLAMSMWLFNVALNFVKTGETEPIPPARWLISILAPLVFAAWGLKRKSINKSGALLGLIIGFVLTLASYCFLACLIVFFVTSSRATKFKSKAKKKLEEDFKEGGQRNWIQVLCNGGMAAQLSILYILETGAGERPIDFTRDFRSSWLAMGVLGAFSCANADTWASELGSVLSHSDPWLITTFQKVPKGVNGGVTIAGLVVSFLGGLVVGVGYFFAVSYTTDGTLLLISPPQWPVIPLAAFVGLFGSIVDSILGATLQYSGMNKKTGVIVEYPGPDVKYICGRRILDNHSVNLLSTIITALASSRIANAIWPY